MGVYNYHPLMGRVLRKVENIVREEMDRAGAQELLMPFVQPKELWEESGRWGAWSGDNPQSLYIYNLSDGATTALAIMNLVGGEEAPEPLFTFTIGGDSPATNCSAPSGSTGWGIGDGKLRVLTAAPRAGFAIIEFPERE